jgi:signal transduction histidine kinase
MTKKRKVLRGHYLLFGVSLAALAVLGAWWIVFFKHGVDLERKAALNELVHITVVTALTLGHADARPWPGTLAGDDRLELIAASERSDGDLFSPLVPRYPDLGVRPHPRLLAQIEARAGRRQLMFVGEGSLLVVLIVVCTVMFFYLIRSGRRQMREMDAFISTVTHEMKTPLAGVASLLETFAAGNVPQGQEGTLYAMGLKEIERLEHMVENVLISGRLRVEHYQVDAGPLEVRQILESFIEHRRHYLVGRPQSLRLLWEPVESDIRVRGDPGALTVVLDNLVDNGLKYGGESPEVTMRVRRAGDGVDISVEDNGIGFDPGLAGLLFEPFHRSIDARGGSHHGTGLGLSISGALVRSMGGRLRAESEGRGKGSRFIVRLSEA